MGDKDFQNESLDRYIESISTQEPAHLKRLRLETEKNFKNHHMVSGHVQGRFLSLMSKLIQPKHILEIGTYTGYATLCLAEGLDVKGSITTIDVNSSLQEFYQPYFTSSAYANQITTVIDDAIHYLEKSNERYDLVFLDANKKQYINYFELLVPKLNPGGVILADNTLWKGKVLEPIDPKDKMTQALDAFNQHVVKDNRVEVVMLPLRDGINLIRKK